MVFCIGAMHTLRGRHHWSRARFTKISDRSAARHYRRSKGVERRRAGGAYWPRSHSLPEAGLDHNCFGDRRYSTPSESGTISLVSEDAQFRVRAIVWGDVFCSTPATPMSGDLGQEGGFELLHTGQVVAGAGRVHHHRRRGEASAQSVEISCRQAQEWPSSSDKISGPSSG